MGSGGDHFFADIQNLQGDGGGGGGGGEGTAGREREISANRGGGRDTFRKFFPRFTGGGIGGSRERQGEKGFIVNCDIWRRENREEPRGIRQ